MSTQDAWFDRLQTQLDSIERNLNRWKALALLEAGVLVGLLLRWLWTG